MTGCKNRELAWVWVRITTSLRVLSQQKYIDSYKCAAFRAGNYEMTYENKQITGERVAVDSEHIKHEFSLPSDPQTQENDVTDYPVSTNRITIV